MRVQLKICLILVILLVNACTKPIVAFDLEIIPTNEPFPEYILKIFDGEGSMDGYNSSYDMPAFVRGISITIELAQIEIDKLHWEADEINQRVKLKLNGIEVIKDDNYLGFFDGEPISGMYRMSWFPELSKGDYHAEFEIELDSGKKLNYSWIFVLE